MYRVWCKTKWRCDHLDATKSTALFSKVGHLLQEIDLKMVLEPLNQARQELLYLFESSQIFGDKSENCSSLLEQYVAIFAKKSN